ncbi:hypothetical protein G9C98_005857 [Cotesia typhae]|uniref:Uncharacterized protein n=1 Tax=Cotesia typhae TaxID=2053667 RepID=A0A8J5QSJ7_9HYME|nr:hypothetical protein G9C98_005857 [Cotesia typhae]
MSKRYDDPRFVLQTLNSLGCIYVNAKDLQSFMKDLKNYRKKKEKAHKAWKQKVIRKFLAYNRKDMENRMNELRSKQAVHLALDDAVDSDSGDQSSQHPRHFLHVAEVYHRDQSFDAEKSPAGKRIQKSPFRIKEKSLAKTPEATRKNKSIQPDLTDPSSSPRSSGEKSSDQTGKILETDSKKQHTIRYGFDIASEDSDSYRQLPGQTKKGDKSYTRKNRSSIGRSFNEHLLDSNFEISDSYKILPQPRKKTEARDQSPREKSKAPLKKTHNEDFPSSLEVSDSYKQLPGAKEKINLQFKPRGIGRGTITSRMMIDQDFPSNLEASDPYKEIARKPRNQGEDENREKSQRARTQEIAGQNTSVRGDKSIPTDKQMFATLRGKDKSKSVEEKSQSDAHENFIESDLNYSDFQRDVMQGRSSSLEKVNLNQESPEQFSLKDLRERSHLDFDSSRSTEPSQTANQVDTDRNLVARDRAVERSASKLKEVTRLRFDDSDSDSDSESNYLEQYEAVRPSKEVGRMEEPQKSQSSAQSTPNFTQRKEINYDSSSKSDSESISQAAARNKKEEIVRSGKIPARSGRFKPNDFIERSNLEF